MKHFNLTLALLVSASIVPAFNAPAKVSQKGSGETDGYKLVWQDLFDNGVLNRDRWNIEVNGDGGGNNELQYYTDKSDNVSVGDDGQGNGCLILTAKREEYNGKHFTSGRINSKNLVHFTHGKLEASIRLPRTADGLWPAFWAMGNDFDQVGWPRCGETDILEMGNVGGINAGTQDRYFNGACHWGTSWPDYCYAQDHTNSYSLQDGEFHLFTLIWNEEAIEMYVDLDKYPYQEPYYRMTVPQNDPGNESSPGNYFHKSNFIIFNLAVGGGFPGIYDASGITALNSSNNNQASMYVNYVKVYQKGVDSETLTAPDAGDTDPETPVDPEPVDPSQGFASLESIAAHGSCSIFDIIQLNDDCVERLRAAGKTVSDWRVDNASRNFYLWNGLENGGSSYPGIGWNASSPNRDGYTSVTVTRDAAWSGAGYFISDTAPVSTLHMTADTHFHLGYRTASTSPASVGLILMNLDNVGSTGCVAIGEDCVDQDKTYPSVAPAATSEWQVVDITLGELGRLYPDFSLSANKVNNWSGNIFAFIAGNEGGTNICFDGVYFYTPTHSSGVEAVASDNAIIYTGRTISAPGAESIAIFDMAGTLVKKTNAAIAGVEELPAGLYLVKAGNTVAKIVVK